ncbi:MAG: NAD(P)H-binding protein [Sphingomonadales bacterium]|nr:NAD(P)H-binding protein [Sphingomonadales bacterium]
MTHVATGDSARVIAITGATGFVGSTLVDLAVARGHHVRALTRRPQPDRPGLTWIAGALDRRDALAELVDGADAVIHVAGAVNARDRAGFAAANIAGTEAVAAAAREAGIARFVHVSSLSAREPGISDYGWSKAGAETAVMAGGLDWIIVRPPAIYGPRDTEMLEMFRLAARGLALLPPGGRLSVIHVGDLAELLLALATAGRDYCGRIYEPDDGRPNGWSHRGFARALGKAVGRSVATLAMPAWALRLAARGDRLVRRGRAKLTLDRAAYFCHPDWVARADRRPPADLWRARIDTQRGLGDTAKWYRAQGWL